VRRLLRLLLVLLLLALVAGHIFYQYGPRERPAAPDPDGLPARMLASGAFETCFWVPYPHQNLGALARAVGDWPAWIAAAARSADLPPPDLPGFGPFAVPPAREIAVCSGAGGENLQLAAEIYPSIAIVAKLAGRLAANPWLAGGEVERGRRRYRVAWSGRLWTVAAGEPVDLGWTRRVPRQKVLAIARTERAYSYLPPGTYLLQHAAGTFSLALDGQPSPPPLALPSPRPVLLALAGADGDKPPAALALFDTGSTQPLRLPAAAVFHPPGTERWSLPGGGLERLLGRGVPRGNAAGWVIVATDAASAERAEALAPGLARLVPPVPAVPDQAATLRLALWLQPGPTLELSRRILGLLENLPLVERAKVRRWRDWHRLLEPLAGCKAASLTSAAGPPDAFRLTIEGCR